MNKTDLLTTEELKQRTGGKILFVFAVVFLILTVLSVSSLGSNMIYLIIMPIVFFLVSWVLLDKSTVIEKRKTWLENHNMTIEELQKMKSEKEANADYDYQIWHPNDTIGDTIEYMMLCDNPVEDVRHSTYYGPHMSYEEASKRARELSDQLAGRSNPPPKEASVVKRGVAGAIIGGVPGAIIGAASAIDKNNKIRSEKK